MKKKDSNKTKLIKLYLYIRKGLSIHKTHDSFHTKGSTKTKHKPDDLHLFLHGDLRGDEGAGIGFLTPGLDHDARATDNLDGLAFFVVLAQTSPLAEGLAIIHLHERNGVGGSLLAERGDQLGVGRFVAAVGQHAQKGILAVESLDALTEAAGKTVSVEGVTKDLLESSLRGQRFLNDFFLGLFDFGLGDDFFFFGRHSVFFFASGCFFFFYFNVIILLTALSPSLYYRTKA